MAWKNDKRLCDDCDDEHTWDECPKLRQRELERGMTDADVAAAEAAYAADPGIEPDAFSSVAMDQCPDERAWIREQMEFWSKEGMRYVRFTEDTARNTLWLEVWKTPPHKEAPFKGHYTTESPVRRNGEP